MFSVFGIGEEGGLIIFTKTGKSRIAKFLKKKGGVGLVEGGGGL